MDSGELTVRVGAIDVACRRLGDVAHPAIVLIRGLGTQMIEWSPVLLERLAAGGLQVVIFDNRDAGRSSKAASAYALDDMAADVAGLMDALDIDRAHIFGISLGGMIAQLVAVNHGMRVGCLFSVMSSSGAPGLPAAAPEIRQRLLARATGREAIVALDAENRAVFGSPGYPESEASRLAAAARAYDRSYCPEGVERQMRAAIADGSRADRLRTITVPTLVIHGADDPLVPPACGEDTARHIPGAELAVVPGMGHNIPDALAPVIAEHVLSFVGRHFPDG